MSAMGWVAFLAAAGSGACSRFVLASLVQARTGGHHPWGTFVVNTVGCLGAGVVAGLVIHQGLGPELSKVLAVGFLGSFTTFSTFTYETVRLAETGEWSAATANAIGSAVVGALAAWLGLALTAAW